jgi:hypothetical protein
MEPALSSGRNATARVLDFLRPERREKYFALAVFFVLTGLISLLGEFFLDGELAAAAEMLAADNGAEIVFNLVQPSPWLVPGLMIATFTLPMVCADGRLVPIGNDAIRPWMPVASDKVPI